MKGAASLDLASQPFHRDRPFFLAALTGTILLSGLLAIQVSMGLLERGQRLELQAEIDRENRQLTMIRTQRAGLEATLHKPENAEALEYALFLNGTILRKSISWTKIFSDLEQVMPPNVRLMTVRPQVSLDNQVQLDMTVGSADSQPVIEMLMRLEASSLFGATAVTTWQPPSQSEPLYRYRVNVNYAPKL